MQLAVFTKHPENNQFMITFPIFLSDATLSDEITITIKNYDDYHQIEFD